jgi:8-oxo-dGTP pyrophosphatase MutT (NUDIX family)
MYSDVKTYLRDALLAGNLPGIVAHTKMLPPGRRLKTIEEEIALVKLSSVLLLLFPENGKLYTCLTRRPPTMKHHPGQISFPGGKVEKEDISAEMTALREAKEEVGLVPDFLVNYSEVEELILFPVSDFVTNEIISETQLETVTGTLNVKYYPFNGEFIWGATAMILSELIEILKSRNNQ